MTRIRLVAPIFVLLAITGVAQGWAQSLGEVAKREEEKKKKSGKPPATAKIYTDEDLKKARETGTSNVNFLPENENVTSAARSTGDRSGGSEGGEGGEGGGGGEKYWRSIAKQRRDAVQEAEQDVKQLESRIAALRNDMSPTNVQDPNRLQTQGRDLQKAQEDLEGARRELEEARQSLANLEDEARRAGAMPGWVR